MIACQASAQVTCIQEFHGVMPGDRPRFGALAQLGEHLLCKQGVVGSIPTGSTMLGKTLGL